MVKKITSLVFSLICILMLCSCQANIDFQKNGDNIDVSISLDNSLIDAKQSDSELFTSNGFDMEITGENLVVKTSIKYNSFEEDFSKKVSFLKQIIEVINPELKSQLEKINVVPHRSMHGYTFSGVDELSFDIEGLDDCSINLTGKSDDVVSINGKNYHSEDIIETTLSGNSVSMEFINNENINYVRVTTNIQKEDITSKIAISFNNPINTSNAETSLNRGRVVDYEVDDKYVEFTIEYTSPEMFNSLHNSDLYNIFGGLYLININDTGVYAQKGDVRISALDNCGVDDVVYTVNVNNKKIDNGSATLVPGNTYNMSYSVSDTGSFVITLIVGLSIALVIGGFVYMAKKRN